MDEKAAERLKDLQMADLGTARREHISTADWKKPNNTRIEVLEASRMTNVPGSDAQRVAEANKSRLADWSNVYKKIGDTEDLENLDSLLHGQSHRIQLNAVIRESGGQSYSKSTKRDDNFSKSRGRVPSLRGSTAGSSKGAGIGVKRALEPYVHPANNPLPEPIPARKIRVCLPPQVKGSGLDLALDVNNGLSKKEERRKFGKRNVSSHVSVKARRPMLGDFARILSPPENFLAVARSLVITRIPRAAPLITQSMSDDNRVAGNIDVSGANYAKPTHTKEERRKNVSQPHGGTSNTSNKQNPATLSIQEFSLVNWSEAQAAITRNPDSLALADTCKLGYQDQGSESMSLDSSEEDPLSITANHEAQDEASTQRDALVPEPSQKLEPEEAPAVGEEKEGLTSSPKSNEMVLVDLSSTPPTRSVNGREESTMLVSPGIEELKGLDFTKISKLQDGSPCVDLSYITNTPGHQESSDKDMSVAEICQRDMDLLCRLMASTTLSDQSITKLKQCKAELEVRLSSVQNPGDHPHKVSEQTIKDPDHGAQKTHSKGSIAVVSAKNPTRENPFSDHKNLTSSPSPQTRLKATAPQFIPKAFTEYRTSSDCISSDSTIIQATPCKQRSRTYSEGIHIFGDHLLPGGKARTEIHSEEAHIFGDHLLPGRGEAISAKIENLPVAKPRVKFSIPSQPTPKHLDQKSFVLQGPTAPSHTHAAPNEGQPRAAKAVLDIKTGNRLVSPTTIMKASQNSSSNTGTIQDSIYAPKTSSRPTTSKPSANDLMKSKYASPE